jgi:hypothetical protein
MQKENDLDRYGSENCRGRGIRIEGEEESNHRSLGASDFPKKQE